MIETLGNKLTKGNILNHEKNDPKARPFLKWAGGKGQLLEKFAGYYPEELKEGKINHYYEPFVGGGAVFFDVAARFDIKTALLCDVNEELILTYRVVQKDVFKLVNLLESYQKKYDKLDEPKQSEFYYEVRHDFNQQKTTFNFDRYSECWVKRATQIIFLNRTCFNGLFRLNSSGGFNVPAGKYKNPKIVHTENLLKASQLLQSAEIKNTGFQTVESEIKINSFVYFDPPYRPISKTSSFTSYSKHPFADTQQTELAALFQRLDKLGAKLMLSNSDPKNTDPEDNFFDEMYKNYHIARIPAKRMINSNAAKRHAINEIIVTNYRVQNQEIDL